MDERVTRDSCHFGGDEKYGFLTNLKTVFQTSQKLFVNLRFFAGHFSLSPDISKLRMTFEQRSIFSLLDILSGDLGALRQTFSKFARHVRRIQRISGSLVFWCPDSRKPGSAIFNINGPVSKTVPQGSPLWFPQGHCFAPSFFSVWCFVSSVDQ